MYKTLRIFLLFGMPIIGSAFLLFSAVNGITTNEAVLGLLLIISFVLNLALYKMSENLFPYVGDIEVETVESGVKMFSLIMNQDPQHLDENEQVLFKIRSIP